MFSFNPQGDGVALAMYRWVMVSFRPSQPMDTATRLGVCLMAALSVGAGPASAQNVGGLSPDPAFEQPVQPQSQPTAMAPREGQTAEGLSGQTGVRQTRNAVDGVNPMARVNNRIQNRVQARLRNRIDRNYDPRANATSPFDVAGQEIQRAGRSPR